jgi:hypothetical protein
MYETKGFDASYADPLGAMMLSSEQFGKMATDLINLAEKLCDGRCLFAHEGGYSKDYVPFCGLAVVEALTGIKSKAADPSLLEVHAWGYQELQLHQAAVVDRVATDLGLTSDAVVANADTLAKLTELLRGVPSEDRAALFSQAVAALGRP